MLLGCSGVGNKLHGFGKTIRNDSAGSGNSYAHRSYFLRYFTLESVNYFGLIMKDAKKL
jgi:hypothetical protein